MGVLCFHKQLFMFVVQRVIVPSQKHRQKHGKRRHRQPKREKQAPVVDKRVVSEQRKVAYKAHDADEQAHHQHHHALKDRNRQPVRAVEHAHGAQCLAEAELLLKDNEGQLRRWGGGGVVVVVVR